MVNKLMICSNTRHLIGPTIAWTITTNNVKLFWIKFKSNCNLQNPNFLLNLVNPTAAPEKVK